MNQKGMYKTIVVVVSLLIIIPTAEAQTGREAGIFAGTSYYLGDINTSRQFYAPSPSIGLLFKNNISDRQGIRFNAFYGQFHGKDADFANDFQQHRGASFSTSILDMNLLYEFNFLPFHYNERKKTFSPFLFAGLGYEIILQAQSNIGNHFSVPFGTGIKYMLSRKASIGLEWSFRKTFNDNMDGINNPGQPKDKSIISHNDWYSFAGFFITFRLFDHSGECPVYKQMR